jgi:predicted DCC family thiol-disulfide oxidoreductase YuxK
MEHIHVGDAHVLVLYDGVCALCNRVVRFLIKRDKRDVFRFAPLQSSLAEKVLARHGIKAQALDTVYVVERYERADERVLARSDAAIVAATRLGGIWRATAILGLLPRALRDRLYNLIARSRYGVFGKYEACPAPDPRDRAKFLPAD